MSLVCRQKNVTRLDDSFDSIFLQKLPKYIGSDFVVTKHHFMS